MVRDTLFNTVTKDAHRSNQQGGQLAATRLGLCGRFKRSKTDTWRMCENRTNKNKKTNNATRQTANRKTKYGCIKSKEEKTNTQNNATTHERRKELTQKTNKIMKYALSADARSMPYGTKQIHVLGVFPQRL
jgi:hypothetical protein